MELEPRVGLEPSEMLNTFDSMFIDVWEKNKDSLDWQIANISQQMAEGKKVDLSNWLVDVMSLVTAAARDSFIYAMIENNRRIAEQLQAQGLPVPMSEAAAEEDFDLDDLPRNM